MAYKNVINCLKAITVAIFLLFFQPLRAQPEFAALAKQLSDKKAAFGNNFTVLVGGPDSVLYKNETGVMTVKTVAPVAGASGWLTAALVMQAVDEGKLSLDDKIVQYLPVFEKYGKNFITVRHCLAHLTGIREKNGKLARLLERKKFASLQEEAETFAASEIETNPGTAFSYSSIGLNIAGRVLEVVSKKRFDLLIKQKLLTPLGMRQTTFTTPDGSAPNPSGGARSTALDYMSFLKMLLNNGKHNGQTILSEAAVAALRTIQTTNLPMNDVPNAAAGFQYAPGAWAVQQTGNSAAVLSGAGLSGTWPVVDWCRGYAFLLITKEPLREEKPGAYGDLKKLADESFASSCR